ACSMRPVSCAGQLLAFGHRRSTSPSFMERNVVLHEGHLLGMTKSTASSPRNGMTGPTISGMISPALRSTTVSPIFMPLAFTTSWLCKVAIETVEPSTNTGSMTAYGVTLPVRPTLTKISSNFVWTSSGGYLYATDQRGVLEVYPSCC